jgi:Flp pilus assembly pilin Flp
MFTWWDRMIARLHGDERGQGTVEYFLVILAATALAVVLFKWMQGGGGSNLVGDILGKVVHWILKAF